MKVFISADIEGVAGISHWDETEFEHSRGAYFAEQMTLEVKAACEVAVELGAKVTFRDAHDKARNVNPRALPESVEIVRGWADSPMGMVETLDASYDAVIFIGYHSAAYTTTSPLGHSFSPSKFQKVMINGRIASEFTINAYLSYYLGVPVVFISGDAGVCAQANELDGAIHTVAVQKGIGDATVSIHPDLAIKRIKEGVRHALTFPKDHYSVELPKVFELQIEYKELKDYYRASFLPGIEKVDERTLIYKADNFYDIARIMMFM